MKRRIGFIVVSLLVLSASIAWGDQKFNPHTGHWETADPDWTLRYNPNENHWQYAPPDEPPEYNPHENKWEWPSY